MSASSADPEICTASASSSSSASSAPEICTASASSSSSASSAPEICTASETPSSSRSPRPASWEDKVLRIAVPTASSLILVYYVVTMPLMFMSGGSTFSPAPVSTPPPPPPSLLTFHDVNVDVDAETGLASQAFRSYEVFKKNYREMDKRFKVFIYPDGGPNTYRYFQSSRARKLTSEDYFFQSLRQSKFVTRDPNKAHLFFMPISCHKGIRTDKMPNIVHEYVEGLISKYPYWNRTMGADHFFVTCRDSATIKLVVGSASYKGDFIADKDVAMPQILQPFALPRGRDIKNRTTLGLWTGHRNSMLAVTLAKLFENDDISGKRISELVYQKQFYTSKFCIFPQVNSERLADSIHYGCIPVILSDFVGLPFKDVLDWSKFAVLLRKPGEVAQLKTRLLSITREQYLSLHKGLLQVQDLFEWHSPPRPYDTFHMIMYELWLRHFALRYKQQKEAPLFFQG